MYAGFATGLSDPQRAALDDALAVDPAAITHTVIALDEEVPIGHAALRPFGSSVEVKKVFVAESARGRAVARQLMRELELIAAAQGAASLVLQTGPLQVAAIGLYVDLGYIKVPPFGKYTAISNALCYEKIL